MVSPVLGIDLGTTNSVVAYADDARVRVLRDEAGRLLTPSIVAFPPSGEVKVGHAARELRLRDPHNTVYSVKRLLGRPFDSAAVQQAAKQLPFTLERGPTGGVSVKLRGESLALPEVSSFILRHLRQIAERRLNVSCGQAVITVPANFNELQRMATRDAAHIAGIEVLRILNEPTAAALAYGYRAHQAQRIAVYDFGGGTFDISILELSGDVIEVVSTAGDTSLGGDDLDRALADRIAARFAEQFGTKLALTQQTYARLVMASERIKCQLSKRDVADVTIRKLAGTDNKSRDFIFRLEQRELELLADPYIERTFGICEEALRLASIRPSQLDAVLLVGGQTRMPRVRAKVSEFFGMQAQCSVDPDLAVAQGAAIQGFALSGSVSAQHTDGSEPPLDLDDLSPEDAFGEESARQRLPLEAGFDDEPTAVARRVSPSEPKLPSIRPERTPAGLSQTLAGMGAAGSAAAEGGAQLQSKPAPSSERSEIEIEISDDDDDDDADLPPVLRNSQPVPRAKEIMSTLLDSPRAKARSKSLPAEAGPAEKLPPSAAVVEARALARQGRIDEALRLYGELLLQDPNDPTLMQEARALRQLRPHAKEDAGIAPQSSGAKLETIDMRALRDPRKGNAPADAREPVGVLGKNETVDMRALRDPRPRAPLEADTGEVHGDARPGVVARTKLEFGESREQRDPLDRESASSQRHARTQPGINQGGPAATLGKNETVDMRALRDPRKRADADVLGEREPLAREARKQPGVDAAATQRDPRARVEARTQPGVDEPGTQRERAKVEARTQPGFDEAGTQRDPRKAGSPAQVGTLGKNETVDMRALRAPRNRQGAGVLGDPPDSAEARGRSALLDVEEADALRDPPEPTDAWQRSAAHELNDRDSGHPGASDDPRAAGTAPLLAGIGETVDMRALRDPRKSSDAAHTQADPRQNAELRAPRDKSAALGSRASQETVDLRALRDLQAKSAPVVALDLGDDSTHDRPTAAPPRRAEGALDGRADADSGTPHWSDAQEEDLSRLLPSLPPQHGSGLPAVNSQLPAPRTRAPLLLDVTPHTLNVETVDGFCEALIERNAPIPTEQTRIFTTSQDQQRMVSVRVSQGESRRTEDNHVLGHIELIELRRAARGEVQIAVTFVIDADGTLSARAVDQATARSQELRVRLTGAIDPDELERMRAAGRKRSS